MPKRKDDSSSSDSGPDDMPSKVAKSGKKAKSEPAKAKSVDSKGEPSWTLDRNRMVKVREFKGKIMVDIREHYEKDGDILPGRKGISLSAIQWKKLCGFTDEINAEVDKH